MPLNGKPVPLNGKNAAKFNETFLLAVPKYTKILLIAKISFIQERYIYINIFVFL